MTNFEYLFLEHTSQFCGALVLKHYRGLADDVSCICTSYAYVN